MANDNGDAAEFDPGTVVNQGVIVHVPPTRGRKRAARERTLLITGLARSGTSMVAALLLEAGVWQGEHVYEPINEDAEITQILRARDLSRLDALIERYNARTPIWGLKVPDLHLFLQHDELQRFRNPHFIVIFRDPVAVAVRSVLSEQVDGTQSVIDTTAAMHSMMQFVRASHLPFLLLSYEKALLFPQLFVDSILGFCGITLDNERRANVLAHVQPNRAEYVLTQKWTFEGNLEGVLDGKLYGWVRHVGDLAPVMLDLLIDDKLTTTFVAGEFRADLLAAGLGNGNHAFFLELAEYAVSDSAVIRVRVSRRTFEPANSGKSFGELKAFRSAAG